MSHQDPYVEKATHEASLATKVHELHEIMERSKFAMLTTHGSTGLLHTRAMAPCSAEGLVFSFLCNSDSGKCGDIAQDSQVNISFSDASTTHWASVAGKASLVSGADKVKPFYTTEVKAWLGDLGDGKRTGDYDDPRLQLIEVVPAEIRYWYQNKGAIGQAYEVLKGKVTGEVAAPGVLRVINAQELAMAKTSDGKSLLAKA